MIIIKLKGGLGNQMFQYAFGRALSLRLVSPLVLDHINGYAQTAQRDTKRHYELDCFNIQARTLKTQDIGKYRLFWHQLVQRIKIKLNPYNGYIFNPEALNSKDGSYLEGFWQSEKYFADISSIIRNDFTLKNPLSPDAKLYKDRIRQIIQNGGVAICMHIRRGDYVNNHATNKFHGSLDSSYYLRSIQELRARLGGKTLVIFVFSDDAEWVKKEIKPSIPEEIPMIFVSRPSIQNFEEIYLMSQCNHYIIANSSFSWWGAWLNPDENKIVIAPKRWIADNRVNTSDVAPLKWIKL